MAQSVHIKAIALSLAIARTFLLAMLVVTIEILQNKSLSGADEEKIIEIDTQY